MLAQVVVTQLSLNVSRGCLLFFTVLIPGFMHRVTEKDPSISLISSRRSPAFLVSAKINKIAMRGAGVCV